MPNRKFLFLFTLNSTIYNTRLTPLKLKLIEPKEIAKEIVKNANNSVEVESFESFRKSSPISEGVSTKV